MSVWTEQRDRHIASQRNSRKGTNWSPDDGTPAPDWWADYVRDHPEVADRYPQYKGLVDPSSPNANSEIELLYDYVSDHKLEFASALLAGGLAYYARTKPEIALALINGAVVTVGNVLDVPGEVTSIGG